MIIRPATISDADALYAISLATGDGGLDAAPLHSLPTLVGDLYSVPYLHLEPDHTFVAETDGAVVGFVLGSPDTTTYEARVRRDWFPKRLDELPSPQEAGLTEEDRRRLMQMIEPETGHPSIVATYPAHMHMNLSTSARGHGVGRKLFDRFLASMPPVAIHIGARSDNRNGIAFWAAMGFEPLPQSAGRTTWMGRPATGK